MRSQAAKAAREAAKGEDGGGGGGGQDAPDRGTTAVPWLWPNPGQIALRIVPSLAGTGRRVGEAGERWGYKQLLIES